MPPRGEVSETVIQSWLDILPAYLAFALRFGKDPRGAFARVATPGDISRDLTSILIGGIVLAYLIGLVAAGPEIAVDAVVVLDLFQRLDYQTLPAAGAAFVVLVGLVTHGLTVLAGKWETDVALPGTVEDTVNATIGFAALFIPFATAVVCAVSWAPTPFWVTTARVFLGVTYLFGFPVALMAAHPESSYKLALGAFVLALVVLWIIITRF